MPKKINYGSMFVTPDTKRKGSFVVAIPTVWTERKSLKSYFGASDYRNPKLQAAAFVNRYLREYYGSKRAEYILSIPQFVHRMKFGCCVSYREGIKRGRGVEYPCFDISFTEYVLTDGNHRLISKRRRKTRLFSPQTKVEVEHLVTLEVAKIRAKVAFSELHESALNFEFDLKFN